MKRILALVFGVCLMIGITGCGVNKDNVNPTDESSEALAESTEEVKDESADTQTEVEDTNTVEESIEENNEVTNEEDSMTAEEYGELMSDLSQFSTSTEHDTGKSFVTIEFGDYSAEVAFQNVDIESLNNLISRGETGTTEESGDASKVVYETDGDFRRILDYGTGKQEWYFETINNSFSSTLSATTWKENLSECKIYTSSAELCENPESIKFDGLDLNSTIQDIIDVYGVPTESHVSQGYRSFTYSVVYTWDIFDNFDGNLRAEFEIVKTENGFDLKLSEIGFIN